MAFIEFIENLQNKPEPKRKLIAIVSVVIIALIIFTAWTFTFSLSTVQKNNTQEIESSAQKQPSPFEAIKSISQEIITDIKDATSQ
jgi:cell division protein FtsB